MWLVQTFWRICGVFTIDLAFNKFQYVYSVLLIATCVYNFITAPQAICIMENWCVIFSTAVVGMYTRVLASITLLSRIDIMIQSKRNLLKYKATIKAFEMYSPTSPKELNTYKTFSFVVVFLCLVIILPMNLSRLYYLYDEPHYHYSLLVYYLFLYIQNLSICCIETQFVTQCFILYTKFREINDELKNLMDTSTNHAKYPFIMGLSAKMWKKMIINPYNMSYIIKTFTGRGSKVIRWPIRWRYLESNIGSLVKPLAFLTIYSVCRWDFQCFCCG